MIITYFFFFFFKTSHPSSIKTWAWAWAWPRGIHRWWDWTGPLLFGGRAGNITRTCMCIVCVLYETIPGKKTHIVTRIPSASFSCSCSWLGYAMLLLFFFFFFFDSDFAPPSVWPHTASFSKSRSASIRPQGPVCIR